MSAEKIPIRNNYGQILQGIFHKVSPAQSVMIVCHGFTLTKEHKLVGGICGQLEMNEMNSFRFDFSGNGKSGGEFGKITYSNQAMDLECVIDYFERVGFEIPRVIGHSMGGAVAIIAAGKDKRIKSVIDIAGITYPEKINLHFGKMVEESLRAGEAGFEIGGKKFMVGKEFFEDALGIDLFRTIKKVNVPILLIYGEKDKEVSLEEMQRLFQKAYQPKGFKLFDDANHSFTKKAHLMEMAQLCAKWIKGRTEGAAWFL